MCGGGHHHPYLESMLGQIDGLHPPARGIAMDPFYSQQRDMMNIAGSQQWECHQMSLKPKSHSLIESTKKPHCAHCGRPVKPDADDACKGCGSWEIEFK